MLNDKLVDKRKRIEPKGWRAKEKTRKETLFVCRKGVLARVEIEKGSPSKAAMEPFVAGGFEHLEGLSHEERALLLEAGSSIGTAPADACAQRPPSASGKRLVEMGSMPAGKHRKRAMHKDMKTSEQLSQIARGKSSVGTSKAGHTRAPELKLSFVWGDEPDG